MNDKSYSHQDEETYLMVRQILDSYGLQELPYYRFKQWWDLPSSKPVSFSGYISLESIVEDYYYSDTSSDTDIDFSSHEQALIAIIEEYYLTDNVAMFSQISHVIGYLVPEPKKDSFLKSAEFFRNLNDAHNDVQHQLYFPPYNMPSRLSKQLIIDLMKCLSHND